MDESGRDKSGAKDMFSEPTFVPDHGELGDGDLTLGLSPWAPERGAIPLRFGPFRVLRELGRGGMGVVYLARDEELSRHAAVKVLPRSFLSPEARARFQREANAASRLDHPNLCGVLQVGEEGDQPWIAMRYVRGRSLAEHLVEARVHRTERSGTTARDSFKAAAKLVETLARAIHTAHEAGVVHRDLKPANVMISEEGVPVILDFGLARDLLEDESLGLTRSGDVLGTPYSMAPEQILGENHRIDARTDVWALGVMLYELLALVRPFEAPTREALSRRILERDPDRFDRKLGIPKDLVTVVMTALEKSPAKRYGSAQALADDLRACIEIRPVKARPVGIFGRTSRYAQRRPALAALCALLMIGVPITLALSFSAWRNGERVRDAVNGQWSRVTEAIERDDPLLALKGLEELSKLGVHKTTLSPWTQRLERMVLMDEAVTLALDEDTDPDGSLALARFARIDAADDVNLARAAWVGWIHRREGRDELGRRALAEVAAAYPEAKEIAGVLFDDAPATSERARLFRALTLSAKEQPREALTQLEALLEERPDSGALAWIAAEQAARFQDYHTALALAGRARVQVKQMTPQRLGRYATHLRRAGHPERALALVESALAQRPDNPELMLHRATALADTGQGDAALMAYRAVLARAPKMTAAWVALSTGLYETGRFEEALDAVDRALALSGDDAEAWYMRGVTLSELRRDDEALVAMERAVAIRPDFDYALNGLGSAYRALGRLDEARAVLSRLVAKRPDYPEGHMNLGYCYWVQEEWTAAEAAFQRARDLAPERALPWVKLGTLLLSVKEDLDAASECFEQALEREPNQTEALTNLSVVRSRQGQGSVALELAKKAARLAPRDVMCLRNYASALLANQQIDEGAEVSWQAYRVDPTRSEVLVTLGVLMIERDPPVAYAVLLRLSRNDSPHRELLTQFRATLETLLEHNTEAAPLLAAAEAAELAKRGPAGIEEADALVEEAMERLPDVAPDPATRNALLWRAEVGELLEAAKVTNASKEVMRLTALIASHDQAAERLSRLATERKLDGARRVLRNR